MGLVDLQIQKLEMAHLDGTEVRTTKIGSHPKIPNDIQLAFSQLQNALYCCDFQASPMNKLPPTKSKSAVWSVTFRRLGEVIRINHPNVIALVETHIGGDQSERFSTLLGFNGHVKVDAQGFSGGIWVYWKTDLVSVDIVCQHDQYTMEVTRNAEVPWYFMVVFASPDPTKCQDLWCELKDLVTSHNKFDYNADTLRRSAHFNSWINDMQLLEVEFKGPPTDGLGLIPLLLGRVCDLIELYAMLSGD
ncbi:Urease subunit gamma [Bienertia sinuspersici]